MQQYNAHALFERSGVDWDTSELKEVIEKLQLNKIFSKDSKSLELTKDPFEDDIGPLQVAGEELDNKNVYIVGGAIRRTLLHQPLTTDIDIMFSSEVVFKGFTDRLEARINDGEYSIVNDGAMVETKEHYKNYNLQTMTKKTDALETYKIQCINFDYFPNIETCLDSFDYSITQFGIKMDDLNTVYAGDYSLWDLARKRLVVHRITYPVASVRRMLKYKDQGFTICNGCIQQTLQQTVDIARDNDGVFNRKYHYID